MLAATVKPRDFVEERLLTSYPGRLGGEPASGARIESARYGYRRLLFRFGA
jgi:hypothetical protein